MGAGTSTIAPSKRDRRFTDPAWSQNPLLHRLVQGYLAASRTAEALAAFGLFVTVLDNTRAGTAAALANWRLATATTALSRRRGYLVWNYWVNNYLLGRKPPAFDILFWNADTTRIPARLHADFVHLAMDNWLAALGAMTVLGVPVDLSRIDVDSYLVGSPIT